jgi:hypothetical protein
MPRRGPTPTTPENALSKFIDGMLAQMFAAENRRLQTAIDRMVERQEEIAPSHGVLAFMYKGTVYRSARAFAIPQNRHYPTLHLTLWSDMDDHLADRTYIDRDRQSIQQMLYKCLNGYTDTQDFRNRLPEVLISYLNERDRQTPRTVPFEEAACLNDRDLKMYQRILPRIELYAISRMIY